MDELSFSSATLGKSPKADSKSFCDDGGNPNGGSLTKTGEVYDPAKTKTSYSTSQLFNFQEQIEIMLNINAIN